MTDPSQWACVVLYILGARTFRAFYGAAMREHGLGEQGWCVRWTYTLLWPVFTACVVALGVVVSRTSPGRCARCATPLVPGEPFVRVTTSPHHDAGAAFRTATVMCEPCANFLREGAREYA